MESKAEAEELINKIKRQNSLEGHEELSTIITEALKILSEDLYDTSTHFLQELLQNADDNNYDCPNPRLVFTYKRGSLRVDSNETGFTPSNIKAICSIRRSTKFGKKGYTGEKGIGFKSVFKVADVVWISSNKFSFKFDKSENFGLIAPIWVKFPEQTQPDQTSFFLQLSPDLDADALIHDLVHFDPSFILFLRKIKEVVVHIEYHDGSISRELINRKDETSSFPERRTLSTSNNIQKYILINYEVTNLPEERKRPGYTKSEIVCAFPVIEPSREPQPGIQNVFSSLPISSYGLKFLLQGDFLLTANRLHIDVSLAWNCTLRNALPQAFVQAIKTFIDTDDMKYSWPYFVPGTDIAPFFQPSRSTIIEILEQTELLESFSGNYSKPQSLFFVDPVKFCDGNRIPFTHSVQNSSRYLSLEYPQWTIGSLLSLGVRELTDEKFVEDLESMLQTDAQSFQHQSQEWHSQLSQPLIRICGTPALRMQLSNLPLVPLSNGKWSSANTCPVIFSGESALATSLSTFVNFVDKSVLVKTDQIELIRRLGVKEVDEREICRYIVDAHAAKDVRPEEWTREQLVLHATSLIEQRWETSNHIDLWFATSDDKRCKGSKLYIYDNPRDDPATGHVFEKLQQKFPMLHKDYLDKGGFSLSKTDILSKDPVLDGSQSQNDMSDEIWKRQIAYLSDTLHLSTVPRLAVSHDTDSMAEFEISEEFKFILSECLISDVFKILNDNWSHYSKWLEPENSTDKSNSDSKSNSNRTIPNYWNMRDSIMKFIQITKGIESGDTATKSDADDYGISHEKSRKKLIKDIGDTEVKLESGSFALRKTFLPHLDTIVDRDVSLPILELHDTKSKALQERISRFGITVEANVHYYIACLESIQEAHAPSPPMATLSHIYNKIQSLYDDDNAIDDLFLTKPLIYSTSASKTTGELFGWVTSQACIQQDIDIISEYPGCTYLFKNLITTEYKKLNADIYKAKEIDESWTRKKIVQVLRNINDGLRDMNGEQAAGFIHCLRSVKIFPIINCHKTKQKRDKKGYDELFTVQNTTWLIPDRPGFKESFSGILPLLAFDSQDVEKIQTLLAALHLDSRRLSKLTQQSTVAAGRLRCCSERTKFCRERAYYLIQLIPDAVENRNTLLKQIQRIRVIYATTISKVYTLIRDNQTIKSLPEKVSDAALLEGYLQLYTTQRNPNAESLSYEMINLISETCKITDPTNLRLLYMLFNERDFGKIVETFQRRSLESYFDDGIMYQDEASTIRYFEIRPSFSSHNEGLESERDLRDTWDSDFSRVKRHYSRSEAAKKPSGGPTAAYIRRAPETPTIWTSGISHSIPSHSKGSQKKRHLNHTRDSDFTHFERDHSRAAGNQFASSNRCAPMLMGDKHYVKILEEVEGRENVLLQYLGEYMASKFFLEKLGALYNPSENWANYIGSPTGSLAQWVPALTAAFSFSGTDASRKITELLYETDNPGIKRRKRTSPNYCFEVAVSPSDTESHFTISPQQLKRIQPSHSRNVGTSSVEEITVLMCVRNVYKESYIMLYIDPWQLVASGHIELSSCSVLSAHTIKPLDYAPSFQFPASGVEIQALQEVGESRATNGIMEVADLMIDLLIGGTRLPTIGHINNSRSRNIAILARGERKLPSTLEQQWCFFYKYKSLKKNQFRLLKIYPGAKNDQLRGFVFTWRLGKAIKYNALSYVWGKRSQLTHKLFTAEGIIKVPRSAHKALKKVRHEEDAITIWIDAICINQKDDQEKARQIPLLPEIFSGARSTFALVTPDNKSDAAVTLLRQIYTQNSPEREFWPRDLPPLPSSWGEGLVPRNGDPIWDQLVAFFNRPWFRRAWIVQEVIVSRSVELVCGDMLVPWTVIEQAMDIIDDNVDHMSIDITVWEPFRKLSLHRKWEHKQYRWCLFQLLETYRHVQSTLMRDRLFALIGLAKDANTPEFEPDYEKTTPLEDIICRFAKVFVEQGRGVALLHRAGLDTEPYRFPSWVPNWTIPKPSGIHDYNSRGVKFNASRGQKQQIKCKSDNRTLEADGYIFDSIKTMGTEIIGINSLDKFFNEVDAMVESLNPSYPDTEQARIKWQVPIAGALEPKIAVHNVNLEESYNQLRKFLKEARDKSAGERGRILKAIQKSATITTSMGLFDQDTDSLDKTGAYTSLLIDDLKGWRFIVTQRNYCGIAPSYAEPGDKVSIICGGAVPFLIRGSEATGYCLVGEAYIDGMMRGEALALDNVEKTTIFIH